MQKKDTEGINPIVFTYLGKIIRIIDGDTYDAVVDLGFKLIHAIQIRLNIADTPEIRGEEKKEGKKVSKYVENLILDKYVVITTIKKDSFGRWLSDVWYSKDGEIFNLAKHLLEKGYAEVWEKK